MSVVVKSSGSVEVADDFSTTDEETDSEILDVDENDTEDATKSRGMANVVAKILSKKIAPNKTVILSKGLTDREIKRKKQSGETTEDEINAKKMHLTKRQLKRQMWELMGYTRPDPLSKDYDRNLQRIATRGVVQLFNAVEKQQSTSAKDETSGKASNKIAKVGSLSKGDFLDLLQKPSTESSALKPQKNEENLPRWKVLQENFMMGASMKDWDKHSSDSEG